MLFYMEIMGKSPYHRSDCYTTDWFGLQGCSDSREISLYYFTFDRHQVQKLLLYNDNILRLFLCIF